MTNNKEMRTQLFEILASLDSAEKISMLLDDLCTPKEIDYMAQRVEGAKLLMQGESYNSIIGKTSISTATLGRINRCIQYGNGGYKDLLRAYFKKKNEL